MLHALTALTSGYVLDLADDRAGVAIGFTPSANQASFSYTCPAKQAEWWGLEPNFLPMSASASAYDSISQEALQIHVSNFHSSCTGRRPHLEPCVPQSPAHAGPAGTQGNSFVKCKYSGPGGQIIVDAPPPFLEWVELDGLKVDQAVMINCTLPSTGDVEMLLKHDGKTSIAYMDVALIYQSNATNAVEIAYVGPAGGNKIGITELATPPAAPPAPHVPPMPRNPLIYGPGNLYLNEGHRVHGMAYKDLNEPLKHLCWSNVRGDRHASSYSSRPWHYRCDGTGKTVTLAKVIYSNKEYIAGGYNRGSWDGSKNDHYSDAESGIFVLTSANQPINHRYVFGGNDGSDSSSHAVFRYWDYGPSFGGTGKLNSADWYTSHTMQTGYNNLGYSYKCRIGNYGSNTCRSDMFGSYSSWRISEIETWSENDPSTGKHAHLCAKSGSYC
jgi:hypothetical protein